MAYLIFRKDLEGQNNSLTHIAENQNDLNNLFLNDTHKIIEVSNSDFLNIKLIKKLAIKFNGDTVTYSEPLDYTKYNKIGVKINMDSVINDFNNTLKNNPNSYFKDRINNYVSFLKNYNIDNLPDPLPMSLEEYLYNNNQTVLIPLQVI
jgi:hypothetical protein